ncbi:MAG: hypothetical protein AAFR04_02375 [Pseudomonadota bacterium]
MVRFASLCSIASFSMVLAAALVVGAPDAFAHGSHAVPPPAADPAVYTPPVGAGWWEALYGRLDHAMTTILKAANKGDSVGPFLMILALAFAYGVVHAVGPGHGKLLLGSFMTATNAPARLGITMAVAAAAIQALLAISVVLVVAIGLQGVADAVPALQSTVGTVSFVLLTVLGLMIVLRQLAAFDWLPKPIAQLAPASMCACCAHDHAGGHAKEAVAQHGHHGHQPHHHAHDHGHSHDHGCGHGHGTGHGQDHAHKSCGHHHHDHQHHHHHHGGHAHAPAHGHKHTDPAQDASLSAIGVAGVTLSMGMRPCTSAFAILLLALANNVLALGIAATLAMAVGVACTLILVAVFAVDVRQYANAALSQRWMPTHATGFVTLIAGALLTSVAFVGLVQAATQ